MNTNVRISFVWMVMYLCCLMTLIVMVTAKMYPEGNDENTVVSLLLKHVTIQTIIEDDKWSKKYPFDETSIERYVDRIKMCEESIESFCTTSFPGSRTINNIVSSYREKVMHYYVTSIPSIANSQMYVDECVNNVLKFRDEVNSMGIPFLYVQTPIMGTIEFYEGKKPATEEEQIAERSYCLTAELERNGIDLVNIPRDYADGIAFDKSNHWRPEDGLNCAEIVSRKLADSYGFEIDESVYDRNGFNDYASENPKEKEAIQNSCGYKFVLPYPNYVTKIQLVYAEDEVSVGTFKEVLFRDPKDWNLQAGPYHDVFVLGNSLINSIHNSNASCKKKILIIGDSFNWPVSSYLSLAYSEVTVIHNASFTGSLVNYINKNKPDCVIMIYNDAELYERYTEKAFDLK